MTRLIPDLIDGLLSYLILKVSSHRPSADPDR
jgi:hypothetical protein